MFRGYMGDVLPYSLLRASKLSPELQVREVNKLVFGILVGNASDVHLMGKKAFRV